MQLEYSLMSLRSLAVRVASGGIERKPGGRYGFAGTLVTDQAEKPNPNRWGAPPRAFISPFPREMAWIFSEVVSATNMLPGYGLWKSELFGRMGNAGHAYIRENPNSSSSELGLAVVLEAFVFVEKTDSPDGNEVLLATTNAEIVDDDWDRGLFGVNTWRELQQAWMERGVEVS